MNQAELRLGNLAAKERPELIEVAASPAPEEDHRDDAGEDDLQEEPEDNEEDDTVQLYTDPRPGCPPFFQIVKKINHFEYYANIFVIFCFYDFLFL